MKLIDFGKERAKRKLDTDKTLDGMLRKLRKLPVNERAEVIVSLFSMVAAEFARMVLDHSAPTPTPPRARRYSKRVIKRSASIRRTLRSRR